jgi:outer membrane protein OmpA-like peptidoglycan-associated protein
LKQLTKTGPKPRKATAPTRSFAAKPSTSLRHREQLALQRRASCPAEPASVPPIVHEVLRSPGRPLDASTRSFMEPRFGHDFGQVRVYTDGTAAESARTLRALAYTVGQDIVFGKGAYAPETRVGQHLLAHELTHAVQQRQGAGSSARANPTLSRPGDAAEREAELVASQVHAGSYRPASAGTIHTQYALQRACDPSPVRSEPMPPCTASSEAVDAGWRTIYFDQNCYELTTAHEVELWDLAVEIQKRREEGSLSSSYGVQIRGYASEEGPAEFNRSLSCLRAASASQALETAGIPANQIYLYMHGATAGVPRADRRSVVLTVVETPEDCQYDLADALEIELAGAKKTLALSASTAKGFTFYGMTGRGTLERVATSHNYWFAKLYELITYYEIAEYRRFEHPEFVLHFIPIFYELYYQALQHYLMGEFDKVSSIWRAHFDIAGREFAGSGAKYLQDVTDSIVTGVYAHINGDMATALEQAHRSFVTKYCLTETPFGDFQGDFFQNNRPIFEIVKAAFMLELARVGPFPVSVEVGQFSVATGESLGLMGLSVDEIYRWRARAWTEALDKLGK